jgi:hypothetical protein
MQHEKKAGKKYKKIKTEKTAMVTIKKNISATA